VGSGGFAEVVRVRCLLDQREYAAKLVRIKPSQCAEEAEERFFRLLAEPRAHANLAHPNILRYHGCWLELEPFSEQEVADMQEEQPQPDPEFEMVLLGESFSSEGFVFGSNSSEAPQPPLQQSHLPQQGRKIGDGSALTDYKEVRVYMLSELGEMDLSVFLVRRSRERKQPELSAIELLEVYRMALDMLAGLNYLHSKRIIHRDIKLHNVVVGRDGRCKLIDFGLAKYVKHWKTSIEDHSSLELAGEEKFSSEIGTKLFSSPEQASSERYDYRTDIYSLAVVLVLLFHSYTTAHQQRDLL
jgi:serine/threonine protein kinase